jgi:hypothetical protein
MLTGLKRREFFVWINGVERKDKFSISDKSRKFIKAIPKVVLRNYNLFSMVECSVLNIQSLIFNHNGMKFNLTCTRSLTLCKAIVMWNLLGVDFLGFDYVIINGRKMIDYEYNNVAIEFWPWNQNIYLKNSLKGGGRINLLSVEKQNKAWDKIIAIYKEIPEN